MKFINRKIQQLRDEYCLRTKDKTTVSPKARRFDYINSTVIISIVSKAVLNRQVLRIAVVLFPSISNFVFKHQNKSQNSSVS